MKKLWPVLLIFVVLLFCFNGPVWAEDYRLGAGDTLSIGVYGYQDLQIPELIIGTDGKISFPMVGEVQAAGLTGTELANQLSKALAAYIKNPQVTVNVVKFRTTRIYVLGEVNKPGMYEIDKQHNLLDAIGMAGGYTKFAIRSKVYVVHKDTGKYEEANLDSLLKKGDLSQKFALNDGDVVYLAKNGMSFINDILPIITAGYYIRHY